MRNFYFLGQRKYWWVNLRIYQKRTKWRRSTRNEDIAWKFIDTFVPKFLLQKHFYLFISNKMTMSYKITWERRFYYDEMLRLVRWNEKVLKIVSDLQWSNDSIIERFWKINYIFCNFCTTEVILMKCITFDKSTNLSKIVPNSRTSTS